MGETEVPLENHWPAANDWQTLSHNVVSSCRMQDRFEEYQRSNLELQIKGQTIHWFFWLWFHTDPSIWVLLVHMVQSYCHHIVCGLLPASLTPFSYINIICFNSAITNRNKPCNITPLVYFIENCNFGTDQ